MRNSELQSKSLLLFVRRVPALITSEHYRIDGWLIRWLYAHDCVMGQSIDPASEAICALMVSPSKKKKAHKKKKHLSVHHSVPNRHLAVRSKHVFRPPLHPPPSRSLPLPHYKHYSQLSANGNRSIPFCTYIIGGRFSSCENENVLRAGTIPNEERVRK